MQKTYNPTLEGNRVAQEIYDNPEKTEYYLQDFFYSLRRHYTDTDVAENNGLLAYKMTRRNLWRACAAPLLHSIEIDLDQTIAAKKSAGEPLATPEALEAEHFDRLFKHYGNYTGRELAFLRAASSLGHAAAKSFLAKAMNEPGHWAGPIVDTYSTRYLNYVIGSKKHDQRYRLGSWGSLQHIREAACTANVTALSVLAPAALHAALWSHDQTDDGTTVMQARAQELARTGTVTSDFFERQFSGQAEKDTPPEVCPFAHSEEAVADGSIWHAPSLQQGGWTVPRYCPANIPLLSPFAPSYGTVAATQLRLQSGIYIAAEILWDTSRDYTELMGRLK